MTEFLGTVKTFNLQKGWGFVECAQTQALYGKDIFLMKTSLPNGDIATGAKVYFQVKQGRGGPEATAVREADAPAFPTARTPAPLHQAQFQQQSPQLVAYDPYQQAQAHQQPANNSKSSVATAGFAGTVKSYNEGKGWGFLTSPLVQQLYGKDVFFLRTSVLGGHASISTGMSCTFSIIEGRGGPEAIDISPTGGAAAPAPQWGAPAPSLRTAAPPVQVFAMPPAQPVASRPTLGVPAAAPNPNEQYFGVVKGFNEEKGWGHIDCEAATKAYGKDVFLLRSSLNGETVGPGTLLSFKVLMAQKGPQAQSVSILPPGSFAANGQEGTRFVGQIKKYNAEKGWGFVTSSDIQHLFGKDIFLHKRELGEAPPPVEGQQVEFSVDIGQSGKLEAKAVALSPYDGAAAGEQGAYDAAQAAAAGRSSPY